MQDSALVVTSTSIFLLSCGLCVGLTYLPCYSAICVEEYFPYNIRLHIAAFYAVLSFSFLVLIVRRLSPAVQRLLDTYVVSQPLPFTSIRITIGGIAISAAAALLLGGAVGYFTNDELEFYRSRAVQAGDTSNGYKRLAAVGITGHTIDILTGLIVLPVSRTSVLSRVLHLSPSALLTYHQLTGYLYFVLVLIHTAFFYSWVPLFAHAPEDSPQKDVFAIDNPTVSQSLAEHEGPWAMSVLASGMIAFFVFVAIIITSLPSSRRKSYNTFYVTHAFSLLFFFCVCVHASTDFYMLLPGLALWLLDWSLRLRGLSTGVGATLQSAGNGWYRLVIPRQTLSGSSVKVMERTANYPLQSWYLNAPAVSKWQIHPFTPARVAAAATSSSAGVLVFLWRVPDMHRKDKKQVKEWMSKLAAVLSSHVASDTTHGIAPITATIPSLALDVRLEGPYPLSHRPFRSHDHVVCLVGGTGITGALSLAESFLVLQPIAKGEDASLPPGSITTKVSIIWTLKEVEDADLIDVKELKEEACRTSARLSIRKHLTGPGRERLKLEQTIRGVLQDSNNEKDGDSGSPSTWIYWSGPASFMAAGEDACIKIRAERRPAPGKLDWYCARWDL